MEIAKKDQAVIGLLLQLGELAHRFEQYPWIGELGNRASDLAEAVRNAAATHRLELADDTGPRIRRDQAKKHLVLVIGATVNHARAAVSAGLVTGTLSEADASNLDNGLHMFSRSEYRRVGAADTKLVTLARDLAQSVDHTGLGREWLDHLNRAIEQVEATEQVVDQEQAEAAHTLAQLETLREQANRHALGLLRMMEGAATLSPEYAHTYAKARAARTAAERS